MEDHQQLSGVMATKPEKKWGLWLGLLAFVTSTLAGVFFYQERVSVKEKRQAELSLKLEREARETERRELGTEVLSARQEAQSWKKKVAARNGDGSVALDGKGRPIFETDTGSRQESEQTEQIRRYYEQREAALQELHAQAVKQVEELEIKISKPVISPWEFALFATQPLSSFTDVEGLRYGVEAAYHFRLFNLDTGVGGGPEIGFGSPRAKVRVSGRP